MAIPVKPINEIEEKSEVSINDKILILDSVSEEARLASKDELKGDKGDKWDKWDTGEKWDKGDKGDKGDKWDKGDKGDQWIQGVQWPQGIQWPKGNQWEKWEQGIQWEQWPQGVQGIQWPTWDAFAIYKTYSSIAAMNADKANVPEWKFVLITSTIDDPDNAKLYVKWASDFTFLTDMSGATGMKWDKGDQWIQGETWPTWPTWPQWETWPQGETWPQWPTWLTWNWISSVTTSKSWKTTTVTMNYTSWEPTVFQVQDWADWQGSGDMNASTYDPTGKMADAFDYDNMYNTPEAWQNIAIANGKIGTKWIEVNVATAAWTAAKVWTTTAGGYTPTKWDFLLVNFVPGCSVDNPTLNIDWSWAKNIRTGSANANKSTFALWTTANSNIKALLYYDWTYYRCWSTTNSNTTYSAMSVSEWQTGTATAQRSMRADYLKQIIKYHAVSDAAYDSTWDWVTSIAPSKNAVYDKIESLNADDISDTSTTNKFVTQTDKDAWDGKQDELESWVNIRTINWTSILWSWDITTPVWWDVYWPSSATNWHLAVFDWATGKIIKDWGAVPTVPTKVSDLNNDSWFITSSYHDSTKQDTISDLTTIRSGASAWATALQSGDNVSELTNDAGYLTSSTWVTSVNGNHWDITIPSSWLEFKLLLENQTTTAVYTDLTPYNMILICFKTYGTRNYESSSFVMTSELTLNWANNSIYGFRSTDTSITNASYNWTSLNSVWFSKGQSLGIKVYWISWISIS